jgi:hypothetical protein
MQFRQLIADGGHPDTPYPLPPEPTEPPTVYVPDETPVPYEPEPPAEPVGYAPQQKPIDPWG